MTSSISPECSAARAPTVGEALKQRGIGRRDFIRFCGALASLLALPAGAAISRLAGSEAGGQYMRWRNSQLARSSAAVPISAIGQNWSARIAKPAPSRKTLRRMIRK